MLGVSDDRCLPEVPPMDHTGGRKASQYSARMGLVILTRLGGGETIKALCADPAMPSMATLHRWRHVHPDFGDIYEQMRDALAQRRRLTAQVERGRRRTRPWVCGKTSTYERGWAEAFCARVATGQPVYRVCAQPGMPSAKAVYTWLKRHPEFAGMFVEAKADGLAWLRFQVEQAIDRVIDGPVDEATFRAVKWRVARLEGRIGRLRPKTWR